jgi:nucleolar MIF4G domain-containing protein 1
VECSAQEEVFNPFYCFLSKQLIEIRKEMKFCFQYALWDQFKGLESFTLRKICNIAKLSAFLVANSCIGISFLKGLNYDDRIKQEILFIQTFLRHLFQK